MSARAVMLRRNLCELLPNFAPEDLGVLLEAVGYELIGRGLPTGGAFWSVTHGLLGVQVGHARNLRPL